MTSGLNHVQRVRYLYKTILRLHRGLPDDLHSLGNSYVRDEFRRHKNCNPPEAASFMMEWTVCNYDISVALKYVSVSKKCNNILYFVLSVNPSLVDITEIVAKQESVVVFHNAVEEIEVTLNFYYLKP